MKTVILVLLVALSLTGCASLQYAGTADYQVQPFTDKSGTVLCCQVSIHNGKEIANLDAHIVKTGDDYTVDLKEQGIAAFQGQQIASGATKEAIDAAAKSAVAAALAPIVPALVPVVGGIAASGGLGAAAVGAGATLGVQQVLAPPAPK